MILAKMKEWFKSLGKSRKLVCSFLAVASVFCVATACTDPESEEPGPQTTVYTVTFNTNGGSAVSSVTVAEGNVLSKPTDPQLTGSDFVGWYADSDFKTPFYFDTASAKINKDTTLYARWEAVTDVVEYVIDFNTGVEGLNYANVETINDKVFAWNVPVPVRAGYTFVGWAISMHDDADKLSYMWADGISVAENTTLHAVWEDNASTKLPSPVVNVTANGLVWANVSGASTYQVSIGGPVGFTAVSTNVGATTYAVDFANSPIGNYEITVTAIASDTTKNSEPATRTYINNALARVSHFEVEDTTLSFNMVENATDYLLNIVCGDENHNHDALSLGGVAEYDFESCLTKSGKVEFKVTTVADGFVSMQSRAFSYVKALDAVTGLAVDEGTGMLTWNAVANADKYVVSVACGNAAHNHTKAIVDGTSFDLKECENTTDGINVSVYAVASEFGNSEKAEYKYNKTTLATPSNVTISGTTMSWNAVTGATGGYKVKIGDKTIDTATNSVDLSAQEIAWVEAADYVINVQAVGENGAVSLWSNDVDARYYAMYTSISYENGYVTWNHVIGATAYKVKVNDGEIVTVDGGENYAPVTFTQAGDNTISVAYTDGMTTSDWVTTTVKAYAVEFDTLVGGQTFATQYKALGDSIDSFYDVTFKKSGYTFYGWYTSSAVGKGNAALYEDVYFNEEADVTLYADYSPKTYTITYTYGADGSASVTQAEVTFGEHFQLVVPTSNGESAFEGWFTAPEANGIQLTDKDGVSLNPWTIAVDEIANGDIVYAYWNNFVLNFEESRIAGNSQPVWAVSKGARIDTVTSVRIPETYRNKPVKMIEANGFQDCFKLKSIYIPNTVEQIFTAGAASFDGCVALEEINVYEVEGNNLVRYWSQDGVLFDNGRLDEQDGSIEIALFPLKYKSTTYRIPEGVTTVPMEAFTGCMLTEITFSPDITVIETDAFKTSTELKTLIFEEGEKALTIEPRAFNDCDALEVVTFPARLVSIGTSKAVVYGKTTTSGPEYDNVTSSHSTNSPIEDAFYGCAKIKEVNVADGCEAYSSEDGVLFNKDKTVLLYAPKYFEPESGVYEVPVGVTEIAPSAFTYCYNINEVFIPNTVTTIGELAFYNCYNIKKVTFGGNGFDPVTIGKYAFRSAYYIESLVFEPNSKVTEIGYGAFYPNYRMESLTIPKTVTKLDDMAFRGWSSLKNVIFEAATLETAELTFGNAVFYASKIATLNIPAHAVELGGVFNGLDKLKTITVAEGNDHYTTEAGVLYDIDKTEMLYFPKEIASGEYTLPDTLEKIGASVFKNNTKLESFEVPNTVTLIGEYAFEGAMIKTLTFEAGNDENPLTIESYAFRNCDAVKTLNLPNRTASIGTYSIANMDMLETLTLGNSLTEIGIYAIYQNHALKSVAVPDTVKEIGYCGLASNYGLTSITFGEDSQLETIGGWALSNNRSLKSIEIPKTVKKIEYYALHQSNGTSAGVLDTVTFAEGSVLEQIGPYAFYYTKIKTIEIPKTVTDIAYYAFAYTKDLQTVTFEEGGTENLTIGKHDTYVTASSGTTSEYYGYGFYNSGLVSIELPARLTEIGQYSFAYCYNLETVTLEEGKDSTLQQIGAYAFRGCSALTGFTFPKSLTNLSSFKISSTTHARPAIGNYAFWDCTSLENAIFEMGGDRPMTMGHGAFYACTSLTEINIPSRLVTYDIEINGSVTGTVKPLGDVLSSNGAPTIFGNCENLVNINIIMDDNGTPADTSDDVPFLSENEYISVNGAVCSASGTTLIRVPVGRTTYEVPNTVERLDDYSFARCLKLTSVTFEPGNDDVPLVIGVEAFRQCFELTEISLAKRITSIESYAFLDCTKLARVDLSTKLATFDATIFDGCPVLAEVNAAPDSEKFSSKDGVVFNAAATEADLHTLYYYPASKTDKTYTIPESVKTIYRYAFYDNAKLEEVILPEGLQAIGDYAFYNATGLKAINIRKNVATIGDYAFYNCSNLSLLTFEEGGSTPLNIGDAGFANESGWTKKGSSWVEVNYGYAFAYCPLITNVTLPERTKVIADNAFAYCLGLKTINIPENVETLGNAVFTNCERLTAVDWATENITALPYKTFMYCYSLESFELPETITEFAVDARYKQSLAFAFCASMESFTFAENCEIESLPKSLFSGCESLTAIEIPATVTEIVSGTTSSTGYSVFYNCYALESVTFAEDSAIEYIGSYAFANCYALESFVIPETVTEMGSGVFYNCKALDNVVVPEDCYLDDSGSFFYGCESLTTYTLPSSMTILPSSFFSNCKSLTSVDLSQFSEVYDYVLSGSGVTEVTVYASTYYEYAPFANMGELVKINFEEGFNGFVDEFFYDCDKLEEVVLPNSATYYSWGEFSECSSLRSVTLPNNTDYTSLGWGTFYGCTALETIEIPETVTEINDSLAYTGITEITIPSGVTEIYGWGFDNCKKLVTVNFAKNSQLELIDEYAFYDCISLENIVIPSTVTEIGSVAFYNCSSLKKINIPEMCTTIAPNAFNGCYALTEWEIDENNTVYVGDHVIDGVIWNNTRTEIVGCLPQTSGSFTVPEGKTIGEGAFMNAGFTEIILPSTITTIPKYAFSGSGIETIVIPEGVEVIDQYAFAGSDIKNIVIPGSVTTIGNYSFQDCKQLATIEFADSSKELTIGSYAFQRCIALEGVEIPHRVRRSSTTVAYAVGSFAFAYCSNLQTLTFEENPAECAVEGVLNISSDAFRFCKKLTRVDFPAALGDNTTSYYALSTRAFYGCENLETVTFSPDCQNSIRIYGQVFDKCYKLKNIELPSTLTYIGGGAFKDTAIESITIPASVTSMPTATIYNYLEDGSTGSGSKSMGAQFYGCTQLKTVVFEGAVEKIETNTFEGCTALTSITFNTDTIKTFGNYAFKDCTALTNITLPKSITTFGVGVFDGWIASQVINANRTELESYQWSVLWNKGCPATIVYGSPVV